MKPTFITALALAAFATFFAGCTVDKTKEGNLPEVEVKGKTELPEYDVKPADVNVGTTKTEVTVPTVDVDMPPHSNQTPAPADSAQ